MDASFFINFISARSCPVLAIAPLARNQSLRARVSSASGRDKTRDCIDRGFVGCFTARYNSHRNRCRALWGARSRFDSLVRAIYAKTLRRSRMHLAALSHLHRNVHLTSKRAEQSVHVLGKTVPYPASRCVIGWHTLGSGTVVPQLLERRYSI